MIRILIGAIAIIALQLVFFEQSTKIMVFSHNLVSEVKVVYDASKKVIEKQETIEKMGKLTAELSDSVKSATD